MQLNALWQFVSFVVWLKKNSPSDIQKKTWYFEMCTLAFWTISWQGTFAITLGKPPQGILHVKYIFSMHFQALIGKYCREEINSVYLELCITILPPLLYELPLKGTMKSLGKSLIQIKVILSQVSCNCKGIKVQGFPSGNDAEAMDNIIQDSIF